MTDESRFDSRQSQENSALNNIQNASGSQQASHPVDIGSFSGNRAISTCSPLVISTQYQWLESTTRLSPIVLTSSWREWNFIFPFTMDSFLCYHVIDNVTKKTRCQSQLQVYFISFLVTMRAHPQPLETSKQFYLHTKLTVVPVYAMKVCTTPIVLH